MTSFGGASVSYDTMGQPTTYEGKTATWSKGRLSKLSQGTLATGLRNYTYSYNAFGQRVSRNYTYAKEISPDQAVVSGELLQAVGKVLPYCDEAELYDNDNGFMKVAEYKNGEVRPVGGLRPQWLVELLAYLAP